MASDVKFYIGLDVHLKYTEYAVRSWQGDIAASGRCATIYKDVKNVLEPYLCSCIVGLEASTAFYPLYDGFGNDNITVKVANVIQIRQLIAKNDTLDARRLSDMLRLGSFPESYIPSKEIRRLRDLVKIRHSCLQDVNRVKNRICAMLAREGLRIPFRDRFCKKGCACLSNLVAEGKASLQIEMLYNQYKTTESNLDIATRILIQASSKSFPKERKALQNIGGIGPILSSYFCAEILPIDRFASEKKLRRYAGVVPCNKESGGKSHGSFIPKTSSRALLRWALVQAAQHVVKTKASSMRAYYLSKKKEKKQKAIMAVARCMSDKIYAELNKK